MAPPVVTLRLPLELLARLTAAAQAAALPLERYCTHALADYLRLQASRTRGGQARAAKFTPEQRSEEARARAHARWAKPSEVAHNGAK